MAVTIKSISKKSSAKKTSVKKAAAKKVPAKKVPAKKSAKKASSKKVPVKKTETKKSSVKKAPVKNVSIKKAEAKKSPVKKAENKRVPLRINRKPTQSVKPVPEVDVAAESAKAVELAKSIAESMKRSAAKAEQERVDSAIRLSRRPTSRVQGKSTEKFPAADLKEFRKRLLTARETALSGVDAMKATGFNESDDHEADGGDGTNQTLRLQALGQMGNINRTIQQIEEALHRIEDGTYGVCTICGQLIRKPRLLNQPFVMTCMECQSEMERSRG